MRLTFSQLFGFEVYRQGYNMFIYGDSGTGKSFLIDTIVSHAHNSGKSVLVMAPTGKAANNVHGVTLHSAFMIKPGIIEPNDIFCGKIEPYTNSPIIDSADLFIIDEISMVRFDLFEAIMRSIWMSRRRSGPKQVIIAGDFYQLPPVLAEGKEGDAYKYFYGTQLFAFQSRYFDNLISVPLRERVRQQGDQQFLDILDKMRVGDASVLDRLPVTSPCIDAVTLCATNSQADYLNNCHMACLSRYYRPIIYAAVCKGEVSKDDMFAPEILELAPGAHVLMTVNDSFNRWHNGSAAVVTACYCNEVHIDIGGQTLVCQRIKKKVTKPEIATERTQDGREVLVIHQKDVGYYSQFPMKLGWAITIHKSQGMTLDEVNIDPTGCFAHGQLYVAVSRCRSLAGVHMISKPLAGHLVCDQFVRNFMEKQANY